MKKIFIILVCFILFSCSTEKSFFIENTKLKQENKELKQQLKNLTNVDIIKQEEVKDCKINDDKII